MGITKLLIIVLIVWLTFKIYLEFKSRSKSADNKGSNKKIVRCSYCKTYVPIASAIKFDNKFFCSLDHSRNA